MTQYVTSTMSSSAFPKRCAEAACRSCGRLGLEPVLDLGLMPPSDRMLTEEMFSEPEPRFPLEVAFCTECSLVQILETVPPEMLFGEHYIYYSSFSDALLTHSRQNAQQLMQRCKLNGESLVIELASNDGYLLRNFVEAGVEVLGIDPAPPKLAQHVRQACPHAASSLLRPWPSNL